MKQLAIRASLLEATLLVSVLVCASLAKPVHAAAWQGIEPFKSRRPDVVKVLGQPISESPEGVLRFTVMGGSVQISFVDHKFITAKKLQPELEGTVLQIVLQHENSRDTPESMKLLQNKAFVRDDTRNVSIFRNVKEGMAHTFIDGTLKTTRYTFADGQLSRARR